MIKKTYSALVIVALTLLCNAKGFSQTNKKSIGSWYMSIWQWKPDSSQIGLQGDFQLRLFEVTSDLEQTMARAGVFYQPTGSQNMFTLGYANIQTGLYGPTKDLFNEDRIHIEASLPHKVGQRVYMRHRLREELRWVNSRGMRTRFRQALFVNIPINKPNLEKGAVYISAYNEVFLNENFSGTNAISSIFDQNRLYGAFGYVISESQRFQLGIMQHNTAVWSKMQWQVSLHSNFH